MVFKDVKKLVFEIEFRDVTLVDGVETDVGALDISGTKASEIAFIFIKPDGSSVTKTKTGGKVVNSGDGTDGKAMYESEDGFVDLSGDWRYQGKVILEGGGEYYSGIVYQSINEHL